MAVQKSKVTRSRRGQRRSHDALTARVLSQDGITGEMHIRHHATPDGFFRGRRIVNTTAATEVEEE